MYRLFSVDDHLVEPRNLWSDRVPSRLRDRAPHVVENDGAELWVWDGGAEATMGLNAVAGQPREQWGVEPKRFDDMIPGCYDPRARVADLLSNGIFASVAFPTLPGFGGRKFATFPDLELAVVCVQAWNDYVIDEWCAAAPEVLVPMTIAPIWDVELAVAETERCLGRGTKALCWIEDPANIGLPGYHDGYWDPLFALCAEADLPVCMHIGGALPQVSLEGKVPMVEIASAFANAARSSVNMMVSPIPRRFPNVKLVWSEGGIGWIPAAIERADRQWERHQYWTHVENADVLPSEVARRNMWFCMIEEPVGLKYRHDYGVDRILWESDYPHADTPFPDTQAACEALFDGVPREEVEAMTHENAEALFDFPLSRRLMDEHAATSAAAS
jgi:predicted TIM-barrel fold metal-dependent hydrolase